MNEKIKSYLSTDTLLPLGFVLTIIGGVFWLSVMWSEGRSNAREITSIKIELKEMQIKNTELENRFTRFETILERLDKRTEILDDINRLSFN